MRALRYLRVITALVAVAPSCTYDEAVAPARFGSLTVKTHTSGSAIDEDGYHVRLDDGGSLPIGFTASLTIPAVTAGDHRVLLDDIADNCHVLGENPRAFPILQNLTSTVVLEVACSAEGGFLEISTATTGESLDTDGFVVAINETPLGTVTDETSLRVFRSAGAHAVELSGIASNCQVEGENPRQIAIVPPALSTTTFQVACLPPSRTKIAFARIFPYGADKIWTMDTDGGSQQNLTPDVPGTQWVPSWSPDGTRILFRNHAGESSSPEIVVMTSTGRDRTTLGPGEANTTAWSPDGQRIVFTRFVSPLGSVVTPQIWVTSVNGTGARMLTNDTLPSVDPAWSPEGSRIAFIRDDRVFLMNADGSNQLALTSPGDVERDNGVKWSPDASRIAFRRVVLRFDDFYGDFGNLWVINADGTSPRRLTNFGFDGTAGDLSGYSWAPDGERLAFSDFSDIYTVRADGTATVNLTNSPNLYEQNPTWSPDGRSIMFTNWEDIFVMEASGSSVRNLTSGPDLEWASFPVWQP